MTAPIFQIGTTVRTVARLGGLALAREPGLLLGWDAGQRLYLWDREGRVRAEQALLAPLVTAHISDDGSRVAAVTKNGQLWWLDGELRLQFDQQLDFEPLALALEPHGQYVVVSDRQRFTHLFANTGKRVTFLETPRPLHFLSFMPSLQRFVGAADFGFVACFDAQGDCLWRNLPVSHIGSLCTDGTGGSILAACFTDGLRRFDLSGHERGCLRTPGSCRLACCDFDGTTFVAADEPASLSLLKPEGRVLGSISLSRNALALVLDASGEGGAYGLADGHVTFFTVTAPG